MASPIGVNKVEGNNLVAIDVVDFVKRVVSGARMAEVTLGSTTY